MVKIQNCCRIRIGFKLCLINRNSAFINGLAAHGHNITVLSPDKDKNAPTGVHYIVMEGLYNDAYHQIVNSMMTQKHEVNPLTAPYYFDEFWYAICEGIVFIK